MNFIPESLMGNMVENYLLSVFKASCVLIQHRGPDYEVHTTDGSRVLIEIKTTAPRQDVLLRLAKTVSRVQPPADKLVLVTPEAPTPEQRKAFEVAFSQLLLPCVWVGIQGLPDELGTPSPGDFFSVETMGNLQVSSLIENVQRYEKAPIGLGPVTHQFDIDNAGELAPLTRQFGYKTLSALRGGQPLEEKLQIAKRTENVTIVLTDIVNFSDLVNASRPDDLKSSMNRYYRLVRDAVFRHGGMLDKFIGDAVLAVFGYPIIGPLDAVRAIKCAQDIVNIGSGVLPCWLENLNAIIDTGTRVGIATGDLWPINIGSTTLEITLLGDTINLAARLEKNCKPDQLLIDNRTKTKASREDLAFIDSLDLTQIQIQPTVAKGQQFPVRAWTTSLKIITNSC